MRRLGWIACAVAVLATMTTACAHHGGRPADGTVASSPSPSAATTTFPGADPRDLEGHWTTGTLTRSDLIAHAVAQGVKRSCATDFVDATGTTRTLAWNLYLRDGEYILYGHVDGTTTTDFDGGTYLRFINGDWVRFTSENPTVTDDYWFAPTLHGPRLRLDFIRLTQWRPEPDPPCFLRAATIVELTNPFTRVT